MFLQIFSRSDVSGFRAGTLKASQFWISPKLKSQPFQLKTEEILLSPVSTQQMSGRNYQLMSHTASRTASRAAHLGPHGDHVGDRLSNLLDGSSSTNVSFDSSLKLLTSDDLETVLHNIQLDAVHSLQNYESLVKASKAESEDAMSDCVTQNQKDEQTKQLHWFLASMAQEHEQEMERFEQKRSSVFLAQEKLQREIVLNPTSQHQSRLSMSFSFFFLLLKKETYCFFCFFLFFSLFFRRTFI